MSIACPACGRDGMRPRSEFVSDTFGAARTFAHLECPRCRMVSVHPVPTAEELSALYSSPRYYDLTETEALLPDGSRDRPEWKRRECGRVLSGIISRIPPPGPVLDVGCGWGLFMECAKAAGYAPEGLDPSPVVVSYVRDRIHLPAKTGGIGDAEPGRYAAVAMLDVLEHVPDPAGFARLAHRALAPGGWLVVRVPNFDGFTNTTVPAIVNALRFRNPPVFLQHLSEFRRRSLAALLGTAGFDSVTVAGSENLSVHLRASPPKRLAWIGLGAVGALIGRHCALVAYARKSG